jgi:hypothetical protein
MEGDFGKIEFVTPSQVMKTVDVGEECRGRCRAIGFYRRHDQGEKGTCGLSRGCADRRD